MAQRHPSTVQPGSSHMIEVSRGLADLLPPNWCGLKSLKAPRTLIATAITFMVAAVYVVRQRLMPAVLRPVASRNADHGMVIEIS